MNRHHVESSSLASVGFSEEHNVLEVEFNNRRLYEYFGVPRALYEQLLAAQSKGAFMNRFIRHRFPERQVDGSGSEPE
jgi:hypothetical protein